MFTLSGWRVGVEIFGQSKSSAWHPTLISWSKIQYYGQISENYKTEFKDFLYFSLLKSELYWLIHQNVDISFKDHKSEKWFFSLHFQILVPICPHLLWPKSSPVGPMVFWGTKPPGVTLKLLTFASWGGWDFGSTTSSSHWYSRPSISRVFWMTTKKIPLNLTFFADICVYLTCICIYIYIQNVHIERWMYRTYNVYIDTLHLRVLFNLFVELFFRPRVSWSWGFEVRKLTQNQMAHLVSVSRKSNRQSVVSVCFRTCHFGTTCSEGCVLPWTSNLSSSMMV